MTLPKLATLDDTSAISWLRDGTGHCFEVACYGPEGADLGENYTRVGQHADGEWYVDEGDEAVRCRVFGPFASRDEAMAASAVIAAELDEGGEE